MEVGQGNSLQGIDAALQAGASLVEIDLRMNRSGTIFLFHDGHLRQKNFAGDARWYGKRPEDLGVIAPDGLCYPQTKICAPAFEEALQTIKPYSAAYLLDIKGVSEEMLAKVVDQVRKESQQGQTIIQCQSLKMLRFVRGTYPEFSTLARLFLAAELDQALELSPTIVQADAEWLERGLVERIHQGGARLLVKTVDSGADNEQGWRALSEKGVDIVLTDNLRKLLTARP